MKSLLYQNITVQAPQNIVNSNFSNRFPIYNKEIGSYLFYFCNTPEIFYRNVKIEQKVKFAVFVSNLKIILLLIHSYFQ